MAVKAIQQIQLGTVMETEEQARQTMRLMREAGYDGIELNGFMIKKMPPIVKILTRMAGMPVGNGGKLDWKRLIADSGLKVVSVHEHLGSILNAPQEIVEEARAFHTDFVVITGMHMFDYSDGEAVKKLAEDLNTAGRRMEEQGLSLLYHNHNCEFLRVKPDQTAFDYLLENTDPKYVNFEFDSYWPTECGADAKLLMERLGDRMKLWHINDRGSRPRGKGASILKSDSMELGYGNMDLVGMTQIAKKYDVEAVVLESHKNWAERSPIRSFQLSAEFMNRYVW